MVDGICLTWPRPTAACGPVGEAEPGYWSGRNVGTTMTIPGSIRRETVRSIRRFADRRIWTHPSILATFGCRPIYQAAFKNTWLSLMWADPRRRRLREAVAVAVSTANRCVY